MGIVKFTCTFGAEICDGCGKKNRYWRTRNFHNNKCMQKFLVKMNKFYDKVEISSNGNIITRKV